MSLYKYGGRIALAFVIPIFLAVLIMTYGYTTLGGLILLFTALYALLMISRRLDERYLEDNNERDT